MINDKEVRALTEKILLECKRTYPETALTAMTMAFAGLLWMISKKETDQVEAVMILREGIYKTLANMRESGL